MKATQNLTFHPCIDQRELQNKHEPKAHQQAEHKDVVVQGGGATETSRRRVGRRHDDKPQHSEDEQKESVRRRSEHRYGRDHVGRDAPRAAVEAEGRLKGSGSFVEGLRLKTMIIRNIFDLKKRRRRRHPSLARTGSRSLVSDHGRNRARTIVF